MKSAPLILRFHPLLLLLATTLLLAGCGRSAPISYYQLAPLAEKATSAPGSAAPELVIGIGPVRLQEHLDRPQLILRTGASRLQLADRHRWAEPLAANIAWVLRDNLATLLGSEQILIHPWEPPPPLTHQIRLEVLRCEGGDDGSAHLAVLWSLADRAGKELAPPRRASYAVPTAAANEEGLVTALSEALSRLSRDIAAELTQLPGAGPAR